MSGRQVAALVFWTLLAAALFFLFGLIFSRALVRTVAAFGADGVAPGSVAEDMARLAGGAVILGISRIYRRLSEGDDAGSVAAWIAGWALVLLAATSLAARLAPALAIAVLVAALVLWAGLQLARVRRRRGFRG